MHNLLTRSALLCAFVFAGTQVNAATQIAAWTFEAAPPADLSNSTGISGIVADVGSGTASGVHASSATDWSTPAGNGSTNSLSSNTWAVGDYYQFSVTGTGYSAFTISWDQTGSNTGPKDFKLAYSIDGGTVTDTGYTYALPVASWNATTALSPAITTFSYTLDLGAPITGSFVFLMINTSTLAINSANPVATAGTGRVDNIVISGSAVPEPSAFAAVAGLAALGAVALRRRRTSI